MNFSRQWMSFLLVGLLVMGLLFSPAEVPAQSEFNMDNFSGQAEADYQEFVEEIGIGVSYPALSPATTGGLISTELNVDFTSLAIPNNNVTEHAFADQDVPSSIILPKVSASKGVDLPLIPFFPNFEVSGFLSKEPGGDLAYLGAAAKYTIKDDGVFLPAVGTRVSATRVQGITDFSVGTYAADLTISKRIDAILPIISSLLPAVTPYAGASAIQINSTQDFSTTFDGTYSTTEKKYYLGARLDLPFFFDFTAQYDKAIDRDTEMYSLRVTVIHL